MLTISQLIIYPIKSLGGIPVTSAEVTSRGLKHDRRWMLIDSGNRFLSQRTLPVMALFKPEFMADGIRVDHPAAADHITIPYRNTGYGELVEVTIWDDECTGQLVDTAFDEWFSRILGIECRLVYMPDDSLRPVDPRYASPSQITSFADAYPFLLISEESLADLNDRLPENLPMNRFRPNIVISGGTRYIEDRIAHFRVGEIDFYGVKLCARCVLTGVDQDKATTGKEPLKTLATYRRKSHKILFGQNLVHSGAGTISIGDEAEVCSMSAEPVFDLTERNKTSTVI